MNLKASRTKREYRTRSRIKAVSQRPRLVIFRSNKHVLLQLIDDQAHKTLASVSDKQLKAKSGMKMIEKAKELGKLLSEKAKKLGIEKVVFDRGKYAYHGIVKAASEGAREGGLAF